MLLTKYKKKRDFKKTPEPKGEKKSKEKESKKEYPKASFVIQKHKASHLHYDFRLEMNGVLKSWAVPKNLSKKKNERRLAIQTEDHPLDYISFHGKIPEGEYGAGTVEIFDKGKYELVDKGKGKILFILYGKKFTGDYALIKFGDGKNWLIFKR